MSRPETVTLAGAALACLVAGLVWLFGPYALAGAGAVLLIVALVVDVEG